MSVWSRGLSLFPFFCSKGTQGTHKDQQSMWREGYLANYGPPSESKKMPFHLCISADTSSRIIKFLCTMMVFGHHSAECWNCASARRRAWLVAPNNNNRFTNILTPISLKDGNAIPSRLIIIFERAIILVVQGFWTCKSFPSV